MSSTKSTMKFGGGEAEASPQATKLEPRRVNSRILTPVAGGKEDEALMFQGKAEEIKL